MKDDTLDCLVKSFLNKYPQCFDSEKIAGDCFCISVLFIQECTKVGIKAELVELMDYRGTPFNDISTMWKNADFLCHNVVLVNDLIYDFSYRQFDPNASVPFVQAYNDLVKNWESVHVDFYHNSGGSSEFVAQRMEWWFNKITANGETNESITRSRSTGSS